MKLYLSRFWRKSYIVLIVVTALIVIISISMIPNYNANGCQSDWQRYYDGSVFNHPNNITIQDRVFELDAYLWRDFMPGNDDHRLRVVVKIIPQDDLDFPSWISLTQIWLRYESEIITSHMPSGYTILYPNIYEKLIPCGPELDEGSLIDVAIRLVYQNTINYYLVVENQEIHFTL